LRDSGQRSISAWSEACGETRVFCRHWVLSCFDTQRGVAIGYWLGIEMQDVSLTPTPDRRAVAPEQGGSTLFGHSARRMKSRLLQRRTFQKAGEIWIA
jgi:hypothetical protein